MINRNSINLLVNHTNLRIVYSDGNDYSHVNSNIELYPRHKCVNCGSNTVTVTQKADICHECGFVYK